MIIYLNLLVGKESGVLSEGKFPGPPLMHLNNLLNFNMCLNCLMTEVYDAKTLLQVVLDIKICNQHELTDEQDRSTLHSKHGATGSPDSSEV